MKKQPSVMHNFAQNPSVSLPRSQFKMPMGHKFTGDAGWLIPSFWQMVLPGDTMTLEPTIFARLATPLFPLMDNMHLDVQHFFVPTRQIWDNYRKFHGEQANPGDSISYTIPQLNSAGGVQLSDADGNLATNAGRTQVLLNYMGIPEGYGANTNDINAELFRAYHHIYNHWYRDQNLINSVTVDTDDGPDNTDQYMLQRRGKRFDYFTQALPSPQRGSAVSLPLGTTAPVVSTSSDIYLNDGTSSARIEGDGTANVALSGNLLNATALDFGTLADTTLTGLEVDLTGATASTVNDLRESFQVQRLIERDARSGTRLPEVLRSHFGVTDFYDASYRPEFLGGGSSPINMREVHATGGVETDRDLGDLSGIATSVSSGKGFTKSFTEHGIVMSIVSVRADYTYQQGLNRFFSHQTRYDTAYPVLAGLGEQAVISSEIYVDGTANDDDVFGYVPRYDEYRYNISRISGKFLSASATPLDAWHLSQVFSPRPTLTQTFIEENPPIDRVIAVSSEPHFIFDTYNDITCARVLPTFGIPGKIDHF